MFLVLFPLFNSLRTQVFKGVACKGGLDGSFFALLGAVTARVAVGFEGEEKSSFFLFMYLYSSNMVGCVWMLDVLILTPLFGYPYIGSFMFST
jgi:hypothetical protein